MEHQLEIKMIKARLFAILEINLFILNKQIIHNIHQEIIAAAGIKVAFDSELRNKILICIRCFFRKLGIYLLLKIYFKSIFLNI